MYVWKLFFDNRFQSTIRSHFTSSTVRYKSRQEAKHKTLFAIYLDDIPVFRSLLPRSFVVLYADDILLIAPSVGELQELFDACVIELSWLDMNINEKSLAVSALVHDGM